MEMRQLSSYYLLLLQNEEIVKTNETLMSLSSLKIFSSAFLVCHSDRHPAQPKGRFWMILEPVIELKNTAGWINANKLDYNSDKPIT